MSIKIIKYTGEVVDIVDNRVYVKIHVQSACASCDVKGDCGLSDKKEKIIDVYIPNIKYEIGEQVLVNMKKSIGFLGLFWGYLLPFIVVLVTLITVMIGTGSEGWAGLCSLLILLPYYGSLYLMRNSLSKQMKIYLNKL